MLPRGVSPLSGLCPHQQHPITRFRQKRPKPSQDPPAQLGMNELFDPQRKPPRDGARSIRSAESWPVSTEHPAARCEERGGKQQADVSTCSLRAFRKVSWPHLLVRLSGLRDSLSESIPLIFIPNKNQSQFQLLIALTSKTVPASGSSAATRFHLTFHLLASLRK